MEEFETLEKDIKKAIESKAYLSALALTLCLPDIYARIKYKDIKSSKKRYEKWFDEWIGRYTYDRFIDILMHPEDAIARFDGKACYQLRCKILHEWNMNIKSEENEVEIDEFKLKLNKSTYRIGNLYSVEYNCKKTKVTVEIDYRELIDNILIGTKYFIDENSKLISNSNIGVKLEFIDN